MARGRILIIAAAAAALACDGLSLAQDYRPDEFLTLDLSHAVLSPKRLGPAQSFTPGPLDVTVDRGNHSVHAITESPAEPATPHDYFANKPARTPRAVASDVHVRAARHAPRAPVALHRRNPVEAQARDASIQVWPCKSGGICNWKR